MNNSQLDAYIFQQPRFCFFSIGTIAPIRVQEFGGFVFTAVISLPPLAAGCVKELLRGQRVALHKKEVILIYLFPEIMKAIIGNEPLTTDIVSCVQGDDVEVWFMGTDDNIMAMGKHLEHYCRRETMYFHHNSYRDEMYGIAKKDRYKMHVYELVTIPQEGFVGLN